MEPLSPFGSDTTVRTANALRNRGCEPMTIHRMRVGFRVTRIVVAVTVSVLVPVATQAPALGPGKGGMLEAFYRRNFTTDGLCHILRALLFEAHLRLDETNPVSPEARAYLHHLAAVTNGVACYTYAPR